MSDQFETDFEATDEAAVAAAPENEVIEPVAEPATVEEGEFVAPAEQPASEDDFFAENAAPAAAAVDPAKVITIVPSSADEKFVETDGTPLPVLDLLHKADLQFDGDFHVYLNNAEITLTTLVPAGSTISIIGKVKGGAKAA